MHPAMLLLLTKGFALASPHTLLYGSYMQFISHITVAAWCHIQACMHTHQADGSLTQRLVKARLGKFKPIFSFHQVLRPCRINEPAPAEVSQLCIRPRYSCSSQSKSAKPISSEAQPAYVPRHWLSRLQI